MARLSETQQFGEPHLFNIPATGSNSKSVKRQTDNHSEELPFNNQSEKTISPNYIFSKLPHGCKIGWCG